MVPHGEYLRVGKPVETAAFGKNLSDFHMGFLNAGFLPGSIGIAVKDPCSSLSRGRKFKTSGILEF